MNSYPFSPLPNWSISSPQDYVTVDLSEPRPDGDSVSLTSAHLHFMQGSYELREEGQSEDYSQVDRVRYSKQKVDEIGEEVDGKRKDSPLQDDPSKNKLV